MANSGLRDRNVCRVSYQCKILRGRQYLEHWDEYRKELRGKVRGYDVHLPGMSLKHLPYELFHENTHEKLIY